MGLNKEQAIALNGVIDEIYALTNIWRIPPVYVVGSLEFIKADMMRQEFENGQIKLNKIEGGE